MTRAEKIETVRRLKNLTAPQAATQLRISRQHYHRITHGAAISVKMAERLEQWSESFLRKEDLIWSGGDGEA